MQFNYNERRQQLFDQLAENSAMLVFSAPEVIRNGDANYLYRQDSDFLYLTGFTEAESVLLLIKQQGICSTLLFSREKDLLAEIWNGRRLGQIAALDKLQVDQAYPISQLQDELIVRLNGLQTIYHRMGQYQYADQIVNQVLTHLRNGGAKNYRAPTILIDWASLVHEMRLIKSPAEIAVIEKACEITAQAHNKAMQMCRVGYYEYQLEAEIVHHFIFNGARVPSYNSIVGGGENACILHYTENSACLQDGELVLIDAGCEYEGYAGDITRTFPINGRFTVAQRQIYELVLCAQQVALAKLAPGVSIKEVNDAVIYCMTSGLVELGILHGKISTLIAEKAYKAFYMHGLGHWLGLDVHDVGDYITAERSRILVPNMVLTVEPGLYITPGEQVPKAYWNIGVRIEDDIVITDDGNRILTSQAIKDPDAIEDLMAKRSA